MSVSFPGKKCCLLCSESIGLEGDSQDAVFIFDEDSVTSRERPLKEVISGILQEDIEEDLVHSKLVCLKCFQVIEEIENMEEQLQSVKAELLKKYKDSVQNCLPYKNSMVRVSKSVINIHASDDDSQESIHNNQLDSLEVIEMELEKMHNEPSDNDKKLISTEDAYFDYQQNVIVKNVPGNPNESVIEVQIDNSKNLILIPTQETSVKKKSNSYSQTKGEGEPETTSFKPIILKKRESLEDNLNKNMGKKKKEYPIRTIVCRNGERYLCLLCTGEKTACGPAKAMIHHMKTAHDERLYICDVCGEDFRKRNELSIHLDDHVATEDGDFQCEVCNRIFNNLRLFRIHKRMHYPQNKAWTCDICGKRYSSKNLLDEHINTHTGNRPYICSKCGKDFASKYTFKAHEKTHEVRPRPFQCTQCNKTFLSITNLTQHERTHLGKKEFSCNLCEKSFSSAHNLEVHSIIHTGFKPFSCSICGKAFARKAEIRDHERTHTGERPYQCEFCGATFSQRSNLQSHKRATHYDDKRYKCNECGKAFKRKRLLDYHTKAAHTGERPYRCNVCGATFVYPEHFKKHRRIHTGEKPYRCEVCDKTFNSRDNRNAHRFIHSDKKAYECLVCGTGFMRKPLLYQHMQAQGHMNNTIVVNQPQLTTDDDQIITVNADGEMEIVDSGQIQSTLQEMGDIDDESEDTKLFITEHVLVNGEDVFVNASVEDENMEDQETVEHIIINGQQINFTEDHESVNIENEDDSLEGQKLLGENGSMQLVKVRINNESGEEEEAWLKIVN